MAEQFLDRGRIELVEALELLGVNAARHEQAIDAKTMRAGEVGSARFTADSQNAIYTARWKNGDRGTYFEPLQSSESPCRVVDVVRHGRPTSRVKAPEGDGHAQCFGTIEREGHSSRRPIRQQLAYDLHTRPEFRKDLARRHNTRVALLAAMGRLPEAEQHSNQALGVQKQLAAEFPSQPDCRQELAVSHIFPTI